MNPAIVVSAYNRPQALARLLDSLQQADYPPGQAVPLVLSIDLAVDHPDVVQVASQFPWTHGPKKVLAQPHHLGLVEHFYACGDLSQVYGSIIYLEDDLVVSPVFYPYAAQVLSFFDEDARIGGVSLYALWFNGYTQDPFIPLAEDADAFFIQVPYTQGQAFTAKQWSQFRSWMDAEPSLVASTPPMHEAWSHFRADEWFPQLARYLVATGRYYGFPRTSLTTGFGDVGTHFSKASSFFQVPLQYEKRQFEFKRLDDSLAVYDSFFEILPERLSRQAPWLKDYPVTVDLFGTRSKKTICTEYALTSRPSTQPIRSFGKSMFPLEANVIQSVPGSDICLSRTSDLRWGFLADLQIRASNENYFSHGRRPAKKTWLARMLVRGR